VNIQSQNGFTPLYMAAQENHDAVVKFLLANGANQSLATEKHGLAMDSPRSTAPPVPVTSELPKPCWTGEHQLPARVRNADANARALNGFTPLHIACKKNRIKVVELLLKYGASIQATTESGLTPLHVAAFMGCMNIVIYLLQHEASPDVPTVRGETPLHLAARANQTDIIRILLRNGAAVEAKARERQTPLHIASRLGNVDIAVLLLQHGADVAAALIEHNAPLTATTKKGFSALHLAAKYGNLKAGKNGMTPLHIAAQYDQQAVASTLLEKGADAKAVAKNGHTPLHIAARKNQMETAGTLLEHGALTNAESKAGFTPLHLAAQQHGAAGDQQARNGLAALHLAAQEDRVPVAQLLVKSGAEGGYTPLHIASHYGQANMVRYLLESGASVKAQTTHGIVNILLEHKADANATTTNGQTPLDIASKLGYVTVMETLKDVSEPSVSAAPQEKYKVVAPETMLETFISTRWSRLKPCWRPSCQTRRKKKYKVVAPETMLETFMSDSEEEGGEDTILNDQPYRYLTADDMKSLGDDSLPIDVTKDERTESALSHKNIMEMSQDARGGAMRGCRGGGVRVIVPPLSAQQPTRITCRYLKPSRINHMPPLMEGEALAARVLEMGPVSSKFLGWREHNADATDDVVQDILHETLEIEETNQEEEKGTWDNPRVTRILTHDFPQYFAVISRIRQEVHAIGPEGGMVSSSVVPQVQAVFPQGALTKKIKVGLQAQIIDSELTAKLLGRGVAVSPVVTVEPRRRKFHKAITLSMPAPRPHTQGMTNQYSTSSAPTLRLLCSISGGTNRAHWEDVTENTPLTFVNDCVSFTTTVSARYWLIDCRHVEEATKMATELYREAIHVPFMARFVVYAKRTDELQAQLRMFCVTDDKEDKALERIERFIQVHEGKPIYLEFGGNLVPVAKSGEQLSIPFRAFRENRMAFPVMIKTQDLEPICRCQFMRDLKVPKGEPSPTPIAVLNIMVPDDPIERISPVPTDTVPLHTSLELALCRIGRDDIIAPQSEITNERRILRNIYQERQASEEIEAYKAEGDNKLRDKLYDDDEITEYQSDHDQEEAKYSPEEKSIAEKPDDKSEVDRTPSPSEESEEDEDVKRSVAERKEQITRKLSSSKIPASKQKKEIREEIIEIRTQIKPDIKKFQDIEQQVYEKVQKEPVLEKARTKTSPVTLEEDIDAEVLEEIEAKIEMKVAERPVEQFRKFDPSSPAKPTPKHLQRHMRNESMRFPSGDFSNVTITPRKSVTAETTEDKQFTETKVDTSTKEVISQKEIVSSKVEEKLDDGDRSPDLVSEEEKDIAEAPLKDKISSFELKMTKESSIDLPKTTVKLTKEALKKHTLEQEQGIEYTQEFVREQSKQLSSMETHITGKVSVETEKHVETVKSVKETIQQFDAKIKQEEKAKTFPKTMRTDSTLVQFSSEEDSEFLKKSTDSETETESQTTVKLEKLEQKVKSRTGRDVFDKKSDVNGISKHDKEIKLSEDDRKEVLGEVVKEEKLEKQLTKEFWTKVIEEELSEALEEKDISTNEKLKEKVEVSLSVASTKSDLSKRTKTDSMGSDLHDLVGRKISADSTAQSGIDKTDSFADLQQSTEKDFKDQIGTSPAHRPNDNDAVGSAIVKPEVKTVMASVIQKKETTSSDQTLEFLKFESEHSSMVQAPTTLATTDADKVSPQKESPVISAKARQFIETVPEDDSVQECFFSKRIYSDSLEDSEQSDSRRHSEAESLKSDQSDMKAKVSSSEFDERAELEETADSGSGFGDEKFEDSVGFTSVRIDAKALKNEKQDSTDSEKIDESEPVFRKMTPKRHSRTESISITKLSDLQDLELPVSKQEFQIVVTEAEELEKSEKDDLSDKISSESSREIEISDRKSSEGISDRISSEDAVTEKKTSSEEEVVAPVVHEQVKEEIAAIVSVVKETAVDRPQDVTASRDLDAVKRESVTSAGSISELRLEEKRPSDAHSLTESRDYTFEESEDDIGIQGTHVDMSKERADVKIESDSKTKTVTKVMDQSKLLKLTHGDSLDDVEGFPEDHVADYVHKLPHIEEIGATTDKDITSDFLSKEREEQLKLTETSYSVITKEEPQDKEFTSSIKDYTSTVEHSHTVTHTTVKESKFDVSKIRTDTLGHFDIEDISYSPKETKKFAPKLDLDLYETPEITKEEVQPVIDEILRKGSIAAAARSPATEKDIKTLSKDFVESEKRSYDAKVPQTERRHSCISPAISLERIAESEVETEEEIHKPASIPVTLKDTEFEIASAIKKSDSVMKQMAENIEIIIKQASEEVDLSSEDHPIEKSEPQDLAEQVSVDSIIEEAVNTVEGYLEKSEKKEDDIASKKEMMYEETRKFVKERPGLVKSLSRDSGEIIIMPKKKHARTFSVQSSPEEVEEQIYTDSESEMDKAKVLEIIEPCSDLDGKIPQSSFDTRKIRTDSLDDADDFPEKESEFFDDDIQNKSGDKSHSPIQTSDIFAPPTSMASEALLDEDKYMENLKKNTFVDSLRRSDIVSKSTTESSVTTVVSTLTKSSDEELKSVLEDATSADFSKISGADLVKDPSKTSMDAKEDSRFEEQTEDRVSPDLSKKSIDLTKDYSKSSIDSKDTSRDFATNELSKDSTVDLSKDYSKIESVKEASRSIDEKTFSEDHSSLDMSKTLASDASEGITMSKDFIDEEKSVSKLVQVSTSSSQETSILTESKIFSEYDDKFKTSEKMELEKDLIGDMEEKIEELKSEFKKEASLDINKTVEVKSQKSEPLIMDIRETIITDKEEMKVKVSAPEKAKIEVCNLTDHMKEKYEETSETVLTKSIAAVNVVEKATSNLTASFEKTIKHETKSEPKEETAEDLEREDEVPDMSELNRRCSNLLDDISQGALIRIDSSHVTHGSDSSFLDAIRQSPRASSAGDSLISETEAHQSDVLTEASKTLTAAARPKSPVKHLADNLTFVNVDQPTITTGAKELVDRTIEKSIDVIDQIKKEQLEIKMEDLQKSTSSETFFTESNIETSTSSSSVHKTYEGGKLQFQSIDPQAAMSDMIAKFGKSDEFTTILTHKETETRKISGHEFFSETKQISSSDDDSLVIKTETTRELRGQERETKEKTTVRKEGDQTETSQKKLEKAHEATAKRSDVETKTLFKSTDDTDLIKVEREFSEQGLYTGRQTKSEEKMTAIKDETTKKKHEVKISERDMSHEQWGKEYFTEPGELENIVEDDDSKARVAFVDSALKIVEKDEVVSSIELSEKGKVVSSTVEHHKEESVIESKEHDDLSSDASHAPSFKSEATGRRDSSDGSPRSKSRSFKKDNEVYEVDFIKEIKVSTSPVKSTFSRTGSQDTHSESEAAPDLPHDDRAGDTPKKEKPQRSPIKLPIQQLQDEVWEVSLQKADSFEVAEEIPPKQKVTTTLETSTRSIDAEATFEIRTVVETRTEMTKSSKTDMSPLTFELSDDVSTTSKDFMIKSGESLDTEFMIKSLESHEGEILQKSMDSTVSAETLQPSEFSTEADSAFLTGTGTDHRREEMKLIKEKSLEDICSSGYDTDLSSAEFHGTKLESERVDYDSLIGHPLSDLSVLEKTIDEVKQSLEAAQGEIIGEKNDGSSKYKQSPSEFQFKLLISPEKPEVITEEIPAQPVDEKSVTEKDDYVIDSQKTDSISQKISSHEETTTSGDKDTVHVKESSPPFDTDISIKSDSGPHSILETESEVILSDREGSSKGSPEIKLRAHKHIQAKLGVGDRRSASEVEGWSSSGSSHYQSFEHSESRPLSSDIEVMMTAQSGTDFETAMTSHDVSSQSLRTSKDYFTAASSLASRDSMRSLDSDGSSHVASIDISDASETLVPSANELKEELMESSTYVEQFLHETDKEAAVKVKDLSDEEVSGDEEDNKTDVVEHVGKMKRSHEMRFHKDLIPEHFPVDDASEGIDVEEDSTKEKYGSDTTISSQFKTDEILSSSISKLDMPSSQTLSELDEIKEQVVSKTLVDKLEALPFAVTKIDKPQREFVDIESEIIPVGSSEYENIVRHGSITPEPKKKTSGETSIQKTVVQTIESAPGEIKHDEKVEVVEECQKKLVKEVAVVPFPITEVPVRQREFVDLESEIIPVGSAQYEEILKSKSDTSVPKTKLEKSAAVTPDTQLDSKQSSTSSLRTHELLSTPQTPLSAPSQSSISTDNGREYVLDDMYDISETPELRSEQATEISRSDLVVTTEERSLHTYEKEQESPTSDEFEMVDKPSEMDDFVVIEEVAKEAHESDTEGKSVQIKSIKYEKKHDTEVEEYLSKTSKKQESTASSTASGSLSDEELLAYDLEQKKLQAQELAEIEAGKRWIQMQFEGDLRYDYERLPLEDIKEEEMTDFDASRIGSLSSQKESIGSFGSFRNSYGSLSESEMASRIRFRVKGENDDISISSLQEFENLEKALMEQYQQHSSSSQDSLNGSLPKRYILSRSQGDDISISSLKEFEGLESACLEALRAEILAKQKEALLLADPKEVSSCFLEREKRSYSGSSESSPPQKGGSPGQKSGSPSQKSSGSPSQKVGSCGSPSQKMLTDSATIRKLIDQQMAIEINLREQLVPKVVTVKKFDERGAFFVPVPEPVTEQTETKTCEVSEDCQKASSFVCAAAPSDGSAESIPGDCEEMMKLLDKEEQNKQSKTVSKTLDSGMVEVVRTTTVIQQRFVDGKKVSETVTSTDTEGAVDIPVRPRLNDSAMSYGSEMSSSMTSQPSELDSLMTVVERNDGEVVTVTKQTIVMSERPEDLQFSREGSMVRELSPSSGRSIAHSVISFSGKHFTDPASGSWSGQDEELSSSGSFSR
ncbi:Ankyrin 2, isoform AA, partial [Operophtera brumata]